jgi:hypothetical protein
MSNINQSPVAGEISNISAPIHPAMVESTGSIVAHEGHGGFPVANGSQTPFPTGSLVDLGGSYSPGEVSTVR